MSKIAQTFKFRDRFKFGSQDVTHYFPGHMSRGLEQIQNKLIDVDCIIEVHDARIPFSGRNPAFKDHVLVRPHVLLFNKMDLADLRHARAIKDYYEQQGVSKILFADCKKQTHHTIKKQLMPAVLELIDSTPRYNREDDVNFNLLIIGVPNVGKSSLINAMRRTLLSKGGRATRVGGQAGVTRSVLERIKVSNHPPVYVYDSPGILQPTIKDLEAGMKLAACATLQDHLVGEMMIADYILYWMNKHGHFKYKEYYNMPETSDDILKVLSAVCIHENLFNQQKSIATGQRVIKPNFDAAAKKMIRAFRDGYLGRVNLDENMMDYLDDNR